MGKPYYLEIVVLMLQNQMDVKMGKFMNPKKFNFAIVTQTFAIAQMENWIDIQKR
jgi:hypothetical protein